MKRTVLLVLLVAYVAVTATPLAAEWLGARRQPVNGALDAKTPPELTLASVADESFQHGLTRWFENHRTLFGQAIYLDNGVLHDWFGETRVGSRVRLGRDPRMLFIDEDIDYLNRRELQVPPAAEIERLAERIAVVQRALRARGQALVPIVIPSKTSFYRDGVDPRWTRAFGPRTPTDVEIYGRLVDELRRRGVTFVDVRADFARQPRAPTDLWGLQARHWTLFGACLTEQRILDAYGALLGRAAPAYPCKLRHQPVNGLHDDFDLLRLLNVWKVRRTTYTVPVAAHDDPVDAAAIRPRPMFVGTSFQWALIRDAAASQRFAAIHMHYYDSQLIAWPENTSVVAPSGTAAWRASLADKDLIVLDLFESALYSGHVYIDHFLLHAAP